MKATYCVGCGEPLEGGADRCPSCAPTRVRDGLSEQPTAGGPAQSTSVGEERFPRPFGDYLLLERIGRGGMGVVYRAQEAKLQRQVALKALDVSLTDPSVRKRFHHEAAIAGTLNHPNVVPVFDFGTQDDALYFTMPLVNGMSLEQALPYLHGTTDRPAPDWLPRPRDRMGRIGLILEWFEGALAGLRHAHEHGVVHRDIKPPNLLLDSETLQVRIADFGLARTEAMSRLTRTGSMMGTIAYMAPEQVRGDAARVDHRSDIYAMGVSLYRLLLNRYPYDAQTTADYLNQILDASPRAARETTGDLPRDLLTILLKSMEKTRRNRYQSAAAFSDDLRRFRRYEPIRARPVGVGGRVIRWARRKPAIATLTAVLSIAAVVLATLTVQVVRSSRVLRQQEITSTLIDATYSMSAGDEGDARASLDRVLELDPGHLRARIARAQLTWSEAERLRGDGQAIAPASLQGALLDLEAAESIRPELVGIRALRDRLLELSGRSGEIQAGPRRSPTAAIDYEVLGNLAYHEGNIDEAVGLYDEALRIDPQLPWALFYRGRSFRRLGNQARALVDFEVLSRLWSDHAYSHNNLGNTLTSLRRYEDAFAAFERALGIAPRHPEIRRNYGDALVQSGRFAEAEHHLRIALELEPDSPAALNNMGRVYAETNRLDEASEQFGRLLRMLEADPGRRDRKAWVDAHLNACDVSLRARDLDAAELACTRCVELIPNNPISHYNLAMLRMLQGDVAGALAALERDVELGDTDWDYLLNKDPVFEPLHGDARFQTIIQRMKTLAAAQS